MNVIRQRYRSLLKAGRSVWPSVWSLLDDLIGATSLVIILIFLLTIGGHSQ